MRTLHIIGIARDGKPSLVAGMDAAATRAKFGEIKRSGMLPKGLVEVQLFDSGQGLIGRAYNEAERREQAAERGIAAAQATLDELSEQAEALKKAQAEAEKKPSYRKGDWDARDAALSDRIELAKSRVEEAKAELKAIKNPPPPHRRRGTDRNPPNEAANQTAEL
jgi:hypothetical protein